MERECPQQELQEWLRTNCPCIWGNLLNDKARKRLPPGLAEYFSLMSINAETGRKHIRRVDGILARMAQKLGCQKVGNAFRSFFSSLGREDQVSRLLCEITVIAALVEKTENPSDFVFHPPINPKIKTSKHCDFKTKLGDQIIWGEIKRYEDLRFDKSTDDAQPLPLRSKQLRSKLALVPKQFLEGELNVLFVFESSIAGDVASKQSLETALFGDSSQKGLFAKPEWDCVSAFCWVRISHENGTLRTTKVWLNPRASVPLPSEVSPVLNSLEYHVIEKEHACNQP